MSAEPQQLVLRLASPEGLTLDSYIAEGNQALVDHLRGALSRPDGGHGLVLSGPPGVGKTHLLHAACHAVSQSGELAAYVPLSGLTGASPELLEGLTHYRMVALDGLEAVAGDGPWERALTRVLDGLRPGATLWLVASRRPPEDLPIASAALGGALRTAIHMPMHPVSMAALASALGQRAENRGIRIKPDDVRLLVRRYGAEPAALFAALDALDKASLHDKRRITGPFIRKVLGA